VNPVTVACAQLPLAIGDVDANRARARNAIELAAAAGAQVIVLPELCNSGYVFSGPDEARGLAETSTGPTVSEWQELAHRLGVLIVGGFCELDLQGRLRNSAAIVDPGGLQVVYHKAHLWDRETLIFTPGDAGPAVVDTRFGRLGAMVCYDLEFPEWVRLAALAGTQLLCVPTNWPRSPRPAGERPMEVVRAQASAAVNRMFIAVCDRVASERDIEWVGGSVVIDADGWPLTPSLTERPGQVAASCDLFEAQNKSISEHNDVHADRRPWLYQDIVATE
jgi:predicted amidohydrolase